MVEISPFLILSLTLFYVLSLYTTQATQNSQYFNSLRMFKAMKEKKNQVVK